MTTKRFLTIGALLMLTIGVVTLTAVLRRIR